MAHYAASLRAGALFGHAFHSFSETMMTAFLPRRAWEPLQAAQIENRNFVRYCDNPEFRCPTVASPSGARAFKMPAQSQPGRRSG